MPNMIDLASNKLLRSPMLEEKRQSEKHIFGLFVILSWLDIRTCDVVDHPQTLLTRFIQNIQDITSHFEVTINHF